MLLTQSGTKMLILIYSYDTRTRNSLMYRNIHLRTISRNPDVHYSTYYNMMRTGNLSIGI